MTIYTEVQRIVVPLVVLLYCTNAESIPPHLSSLALIVALEVHRLADVDRDLVVGVEPVQEGRHVARRLHGQTPRPCLRRLFDESTE